MNILLTFLDNFVLLNILNIFIDIKKEYHYTYYFLLITLFIEGLILPYLIPNATISLLIPIFTIMIFYFITIKHDYHKIIIYELAVFINLTIIRSLILLLGTVLFKINLDLLLANQLALDTLSLISIALFFLEYLYLKVYLKQSSLQIPSKIKAVIIIILIISIIINILTIDNYVYHHISNPFYLAIIIASLIINYLIWFICVQLSSYYQKSIEQDLYLKSIEYGKDLVATINQSTEEYNRLHHDLKHHLLVIKNMVNHNDKNINAYVNNLKINTIELVNSGNLIVDYLINDKARIAKKNNIDLKVFITGIPTSYIDDIDMCIILGNLLDNAINGANKCGNKFINIKIDFDISKTIINVTNSYHLDHFDPRKIKPKNGHGYGLLNIRNTVEKYSGIDIIETNDNTIKHCCVLFKQ